MGTTHWIAGAIPVLLLSTAAAQTTPTQEERQALAPGGTIRVGYLSNSPVHVTRDPVSGEQKGVAIDIGKELARCLGVRYEGVGYASVSELEASARSGQWDVVVFAATPARAELMDFSPPLMEVEVGYLVPPGSSLRTLADVDQPGIRIAVQEKTVSDTRLSAFLKSATLIRVPNPTDPVDVLAAGKADAVANLKPFLFRSSGKVPESRVLAGQLFADRISIAVPKGRSTSMGYVRRFVEEAKSSGFIRESIERAGLRAVVVAPPQ